MDRLPSADEFKAELASRDEKIREGWIKTMEARIVREELQKCHKAEGVNHYSACADLAKTYHSLLLDAKVKGFREIELA
ncbi:uncharacterized protein PFL1_04283 [Pseudozyma flocculosa PF-1]|uniref:NADH-ubiquinone oxidoreductase 12 kDa subunit n=2 Tax=Pseudozyma flocculosa TaxID=84751 RepID=A0A061HBK1_9BASI|nr:uncharacterized protein PFL1_04283 [Pseudozyma flocculosa PF-1]EPQ27956.1 hypothetical protein PFL1_04283 [Pseudozyma flocculosa PF-1]SPO42249.1 probable NADH-ubiquinone oxidoreductase 12 kDa subunit [Pseudozyma flocculosa]